jgi:PAS domain S-box-containing protein
MPTDAPIPSQSDGLLRARLAAITEASENAVITCDLQGNVLDWSPAAEMIYGFAAVEMIGRPLSTIIPDDKIEKETHILNRVANNEAVHRFETSRLSKKGGLVSVSVSVKPLCDGTGTVAGLLRIERDVTLQKERDREFCRLNKLYAAMGQVNHAIVFSKSREELLDRVCRALVEDGGFHMAWIGWVEESTCRLLPAAVAGEGADYVNSVMVYGDDRAEGRGPAGTAFRTGRPCKCEDIEKEANMEPWRRALREFGFRSVASFPIRVQGTPRGALSMYASELNFFRDKEMALLEEAANDLSYALTGLEERRERRVAEITAREEQSFSTAMIETIPGILYLYDDRLRFLRWNRHFEEVSGYTPEEIARISPLDLFRKEDRPGILERIGEVFEKGSSWAEAAFLSKNGKETPYYLTGSRIIYNGATCLIGVGVDISQRVHAEQRYRTLFEHAPDGLLIADANSHYIDANPSICRMLGYSHEEMITLHRSQIVSASELEHVPRALEDLRREGIFRREWRLRRKDGSEFIADTITTLMPDGGTLSITRDVTEKQRREAVLAQALEHEKELTEEARAGERAKGEFLAVMSHEIRTPLNGILGFSELLAHTPSLPEEALCHARTIVNSGEALLHLLDDVLDFSRIEAGRMPIEHEAFSPAQILESTRSLLASLATEKRLDMRVSVEPDVPHFVIGDAGRIRQILLNLAGNAVKFTQRGGVTLSLRRGKETSRLEFLVSDTGPGIAPEKIASIFQPFTQADSSLTRRHGGTGLGLTISLRLAELMGGTLTVESHPGEGAEFLLALPLAEAASGNTGTPTDSPVTLDPEFATKHPLRVLVVEDDKVNLRLIQTILKRLGYETHAASNGAEAVEVFREIKPDCILMDLQMPELDGIEATRAIREIEKASGRKKCAYIAALTADIIPVDRKHCFEAGMNTYLSKPVKIAAIAATLVEASSR